MEKTIDDILEEALDNTLEKAGQVVVPKLSMVVSYEEAWEIINYGPLNDENIQKLRNYIKFSKTEIVNISSYLDDIIERNNEIMERTYKVTDLSVLVQHTEIKAQNEIIRCILKILEEK